MEYYSKISRQNLNSENSSDPFQLPYSFSKVQAPKDSSQNLSKFLSEHDLNQDKRNSLKKLKIQLPPIESSYSKNLNRFSISSLDNLLKRPEKIYSSLKHPDCLLNATSHKSVKVIKKSLPSIKGINLSGFYYRESSLDSTEATPTFRNNSIDYSSKRYNKEMKFDEVVDLSKGNAIYPVAPKKTLESTSKAKGTADCANKNRDNELKLNKHAKKIKIIKNKFPRDMFIN